MRLQLADAKAQHAKQETQARQGMTAQGRQFFQKGLDDAKRFNWPAAVRNFQMALTFEPNNSLFREKLEEARLSQKAEA